VNVAYQGEATYISPGSQGEYLSWSVGDPAQVYVSNLFGVREVKHFDASLLPENP
jgi:hypothetical protein